jgi:hypothetical protein
MIYIRLTSSNLFSISEIETFNTETSVSKAALADISFCNLYVYIYI